MIPASATVMVQPIHCPYILRQNSVITEAVLGVDLTTLDAWRVGTFREVDLRSSGVPHEVHVSLHMPLPMRNYMTIGVLQ